MSQTSTAPTPAAPRLRWGFVADGVVKVLLAVAYAVAAGSLGQFLGVASWLMVVAGVSLLFGGLAVIGYVHHRPARTYVRFLAAHDGGWALATLVALAMAWQGSGAAGELWIGYQSVAAVALAIGLVGGQQGNPNQPS